MANEGRNSDDDLDDQWLYDHLMKNDGRVKLLKCQEERIIYLRTIGCSYKAIRAHFLDNISESRIYYIVNPASYEVNKRLSSVTQSKRKYLGSEDKKKVNKKHWAKKRKGSGLLEGTLFDNQ